MTTETTEKDLVSEVEELLEKHERVDAVTLTRSCKWNDHKGCVRDWCCCVCHDKFEELAPDLLRRLVDEVKQSRRLVEIQSHEADGDLTTIQKALAENAALRAQLAQAHSDNERLALVVQNIEEREAAVCPEGVGFDEYIRTLQRKLETRPQAGREGTC